MDEQGGLFERAAYQPLAERIRPRTLEEFVGQEHLLGKGKVLRRLIENDHITSMIFWGPPGVGKTTLAQIIAARTQAKFINFSAVTSGIKDIRTVMQEADRRRIYGERIIVFVDEIHRFNKAQQDAFLPFVEKGSIVLIGEAVVRDQQCAPVTLPRLCPAGTQYGGYQTSAAARYILRARAWPSAHPSLRGWIDGSRRLCKRRCTECTLYARDACVERR